MEKLENGSENICNKMNVCSSDDTAAKVEVEFDNCKESSPHVPESSTAKPENELNTVDEKSDCSILHNTESDTKQLNVIPSTINKKMSEQQVSTNSQQSFHQYGARLEGLATKMHPSHQLIEITKNKFTMGRSFEADLLIKDINISREQATFTFADSKWTILDNSSNGIRVNGQRIKKGVPFKLEFQDELLFSDQTEKYAWRFVSITDKENDGLEANSRKRKIEQGDFQKRIKLDLSKASLSEKEREHSDNLLKRIESERLEREKVEKKMLEEKRQREALEARMQEEELKKTKEMEEMRKKNELITKQLEEARLEKEAINEAFEKDMIKLREEKERIEQEQKERLEQMRQSEEKTREEMKVKEEENKIELELILKRIEEEKERASITAEDIQHKESKIAELEKAKEAAERQSETIIKQQQQEKDRIAEEMAVERQKHEEENQKKEAEMCLLRKENEEKNRKVVEAQSYLQLQEEQKKRQEEENLAKLKEIEKEKARAASSEEENRQKEFKIKELEGENQTLQMQQEMVRETGAREVRERMEDTLDQQSCSICMELPINPYILSCSHHYCWLCLQQWKAKSKKKSFCPQCRVEITSETKGLSIVNLIEAMISQLRPEKIEERKKNVEERTRKEQEFRENLGSNSNTNQNGSRIGGARGRGGDRGRGGASGRGGDRGRGVDRGRGGASGRGGSHTHTGGQANHNQGQGGPPLVLGQVPAGPINNQRQFHVVSTAPGTQPTFSAQSRHIAVLNPNTTNVVHTARALQIQQMGAALAASATSLSSSSGGAPAPVTSAGTSIPNYVTHGNNISNNGVARSVIVVSRPQTAASTSVNVDTNAGSVAAYVNVTTTPVAGGSGVSHPQSAPSTSSHAHRQEEAIVVSSDDDDDESSGRY